MKIYFATAPSNEPKIQELHRMIISEIKRFGTVLDQWKTQATIMNDHVKHPDQQIHDQSVRQLEIADGLIAEVTHPSLSVGYELCLAEQLDLPTIALDNPSNTVLSPIITGARKLNVITYGDWPRAKRIIDGFLNKFKS